MKFMTPSGLLHPHDTRMRLLNMLSMVFDGVQKLDELVHAYPEDHHVYESVISVRLTPQAIAHLKLVTEAW